MRPGPAPARTAPARARPARSRGRGRSAARAVGDRRRRTAARSDSLVIGRPPRPATTVVAVRARSPRAPSARSAETIPPIPTARAFSSTTTRLASLERRADLLQRERPERLDPERADADPLLAQLVDHLLDRPQHRAERDDDRLGVLGAVGARPARPTSRPKAARTRPRSRGIRSSACICLACTRYLTSMNASGPTIAPIVTGSEGSSTWRGSNGGRKASTCSWVGDVDPLVGVGEDEAVHADHHRQRELLREPEGLDVQVERLLVGLGVELDPAGVALGHRVASGRSRC